MKSMLCASLLVVVLSAHVPAAVQTEVVRYRHDGTELEGTIAWDDAVTEKRPGVLVVHEWWGLNEYARSRAKNLAELGYVAFALDMYGKGKITEHPRQAGEWAAQIRSKTDQWRARASAGLDILRNDARVDPRRMAAIGYCFGGSTVLQLAYGGTELRGVVSFHGALPVPSSEDRQRIHSSILVCHGAADGFISEESLLEFRSAMAQSDVDWQMVYYAGARHGFTNPAADEYGLENLKYDPAADRRSWENMRQFFTELFSAQP